MGALSDYAVDNLNNLTFRDEAFASPTSVYLGWFVTPPASDATAVEVTGGGYTRQAIGFAAPVDGTIEQDTAATWTTFHSTTDQMLSGWGIFDAATAGNLLAFGRTPSFLVTQGTGFTAPAGAISIASNDRHMSDYLATAWLAHLLNNTAYTPPSQVFLSLCDTTPTATTAGVEAGDRRLVTFATSSGRSVVTDLDATWSPLDGTDPHTLEGWALYDDATTGEVLRFADWTGGALTVPANDTLTLPAGWLTLRVN